MITIRKSVSLLLMLTCPLWVNAGEPESNLRKIKSIKAANNSQSIHQSKAALISRQSDSKINQRFNPNQICNVDDNGQNWQKLQLSLHKKSKSSRSFDTAVTARSNSLVNTATFDGDGVEGRYYIPVVFHVYGAQFTCDDASADCLTDAKIEDALVRLNEDFQGTNDQDGPIAPQFQAIRENLNIEFVLAKKAPNGDDTTGIVRYDREQAGYGNGEGFDEAIAVDAWDNFKYMNVYIMNDLYDDGDTNNSGVAWYPEIGMSNRNTARVVYNGWYVGDNTDENFRSVLTHEFGHWLNLPHTFAGETCSLENETFCGLTGDRSCDTPQMHISSDMFNNAPNCLGQPTNTENFMHYTSNYAMFTQDQVDRMTAALHSDARNTLWSNDNLVAAGLGHLTNNVAPYWDGVSGLDVAPEGEVIATFESLSADEGDVDTFEVTAPVGTQALAFYLNGYREDPDMYVSKGQSPTLGSDGNWLADFISFEASGQPEFVGVLEPSTEEPYFATVHAFSGYSQADLNVFAVDDPLLADGNKRYHVIKQDNIWAYKGTLPHTYTVNIPENANKVVAVLAGNYGGDPDMYISLNKAVSVDESDCAPFSAAKIAEFCQFEQGGALNILIDPFEEYWDAELHIYYETKNSENQAPVAVVDSKHYAIVGHELHFDASQSNDVDGDIVSYLWDFGDGNTSSDTKPIHVYENVGQYQAKLTVIDNLGATSSVTTEVSIDVTHPNDKPLCDGCKRIYLIEEFNLASAEGATPRTYQFLVPPAASLAVFEMVSHYSGDPDIHVSQNKIASLDSFDCRPWAAAQSVEQCEFTEGGVFNVLIDPYKAYSGMQFKAYYDIHEDADTSLPNQQPVAQSNGVYHGYATSPVNFSSEGSLDPDGEIVSFQWDFGEGGQSTEENPSYAFEKIGKYTVSLTVTDDQGSAHSSITDVVVYPVGDIDQDGDVDRDDMKAFIIVVRSNETLDPVFDLNSDGVINSRDVRMLSALCSYARCANIAPEPTPPTAVANVALEVTLGQTTAFDSSNSVTSGQDRYGYIASYQWDFGDGNSSNEANPNHVYQSVGNYAVSLTVTDNKGLSASHNVSVLVNFPPLANLCLDTPADESGRLESGAAVCTGEQNGVNFSIANISAHQSVAITVAHGVGDVQLYYRNGGWPRVGDELYDASSTDADNQACIYVEIDEEAEYWGYIQLLGDTSGATIVADFDTPGCRPVQ